MSGWKSFRSCAWQESASAHSRIFFRAHSHRRVSAGESTFSNSDKHCLFWNDRIKRPRGKMSRQEGTPGKQKVNSNARVDYK